MEAVYSGVTGAALAMFKAQGTQFTLSGEENLPRNGGAVLALNHISYFDFLYVGWAVRRAGRRVRYLVKSELYANPVLKFALDQMGHIPVDRTAGSGAFAAALEALRSGEVIALFPEGTVSRSLELTDFKSGATRLARDAGVPLIPVVIWGSQRVWGKETRKHLLRSRIPVHIQIGAPVTVPSEADVSAVTDRLKQTMSQMLHQMQQHYPAMTAQDRQYLPARLGGTRPTLDEARALERAEAAERRRKKAAQIARRKG